jgi:hypothetical protein
MFLEGFRCRDILDILQDYRGQVGDTTLFSKNISSRRLGKGLDAILRMGGDIDGIIECDPMLYGNTISSVDQLPSVDDTTRFHDEPDAFFARAFRVSSHPLEINDSLPSNVAHFDNVYIYCFQVYVGLWHWPPSQTTSRKKEIATGNIRESQLPWPEGRSPSTL